MLGRASVPDPIARLNAPVDSGVVLLTSTHQVPVNAGREGEGGNTTANDASRTPAGYIDMGLRSWK